GRRRFARGGPVRELVEHAHARQGERAVEQVLAQHADPLRIEAIESPDRRDVLLETEVCLRHRYLQELLLVGANSFARFRPVTPRPNEFGPTNIKAIYDNVNLLVAFVNYMTTLLLDRSHAAMTVGSAVGLSYATSKRPGEPGRLSRRSGAGIPAYARAPAWLPWRRSSCAG